MKPTWTIHVGDVRDTLAALPDNSVQCVVTSPPYWGLRDYGTATWDGGEAECDHLESREFVNPKNTLGPNGHLPATNAANRMHQRQFRDICGKCGARRIDSQLGLEPTPDAYVANMVAVFREVRRVLREDRTCWLNLGDSYAGGGYSNHTNTGGAQRTDGGKQKHTQTTTLGLKPKDLVGIPWRVAFALQADGWYLRSEIIWHKPNPMPESVTDRPTKAHEQVFLLTKRASYFYDTEAIKEDGKDWSNHKPGSGILETHHYGAGNGGNAGLSALAKRIASGDQPMTRNKRSVWTVATTPYAGAHFATFPPDLITPMILAGTSAVGCCQSCGDPYERDVEKESFCKSPRGSVPSSYRANLSGPQQGNVGVKTQTLGWLKKCSCQEAEPVPCTVLDPFTGSGTTGEVAILLGRSFVGCELNPDYVTLARERIGGAAPMFADERVLPIVSGAPQPSIFDLEEP